MCLGAWKSISELEEEISLQELNVILGAKRDAENRLVKVIMASVGVSVDDLDSEAVTGDDIKTRVLSGGRDKDDVTSLVGQIGAEAGFQIGPDLGYEVMG